MLKIIAVVGSVAGVLLAFGHIAAAQYAGPPIIVQTPQLPPPQISNPTTLKPLTGPN
jgi:hypothetical protein